MRAIADVDAALSGAITLARYRELIGFLEHVLAIVRLPREVMDYLHGPLADGSCEAEPGGSLPPDARRDGYLRLWRAHLLNTAGASLMAAVPAVPHGRGGGRRSSVWRLRSDAALESYLSAMGGFVYGKWWQWHLRRPRLTIPVLEFLAACVNVLQFYDTLAGASDIVMILGT